MTAALLRKRCLCFLITCLVFIAAGARAQLTYDRSTFVHGYASDPGMWTLSYVDLGTTPPGYLLSSVVLKTLAYPDLNLQVRYSTQVGTLGNFVLTNAGKHVLIGHSLGSLVSRGVFITNASARPAISGIIAITPPHQGTLMADSAVKIRNYFGDVQRRINGALPGLVMDAQIISFLYTWASGDPGGGFALFVGATGYILTAGSALNLTTLYQLTEIPALADLKTNSPAIDSLNRYFTDSQIQRANLYGSIPIQNAALRVFYSSRNDDAGFPDGVKTLNQAIALFKACKSFNYATIILWGHGRACGFAVKVLRRMDDRWTRYINGTDASGNPRRVPFDGVVSNERSRYPSPNPISFDRVVPGANHLNVYKTRLGLDQVRDAMLSIGMQPVNPPPNPITAVSVSGATRLNGCQAGTWTATRTGGTAPINYEWTVEGQTINTGTDNRLFYTNSGSAPSIFVKVTAKDVNFSSKASSPWKTNLTLPGSC
jgi:hypothetical protein